MNWQIMCYWILCSNGSALETIKDQLKMASHTDGLSIRVNGAIRLIPLMSASKTRRMKDHKELEIKKN